MKLRVLTIIALSPIGLNASTLRIDFSALISNVVTESTSNLGDMVTGRLFLDLDTLPDVFEFSGVSSYSYQPNPSPQTGLTIEASGVFFDYTFSSADANIASILQPLITVKDSAPLDSLVFQVTDLGGDRMAVLGFEDSSAPYNFISGSEIPLSFSLSSIDSAQFTLWSNSSIEFEANIVALSVTVIPEPKAAVYLIPLSALFLSQTIRRRNRCTSK